MRLFARALLCFCAVFALTASASAVLDLTVEELAQRAHAVVRGKVTRTWTEWDAGHKRIWTYAEIAPAELIKGAKTTALRIRQPGGRVGDVEQIVSGAARFEAGEDVVLFLERAKDQPGVHDVLAMAAGAVRLRIAETGELRAERRLEGLELVKQSARASPSIRVVDRDDLGEAEKFLARVRLAAGAKH